MALSLDPNPYGCPICVGATPARMRDVVTALCIKLQDQLRPTIHVINPSRGKSYPILHLARAGEERSRLVVFPAWEDDDENPRRRVGWGRQMTLLQRIVDAGVRGETLQQYGASARTGDHTDAWAFPVARTAAEMMEVFADFHTYLGDLFDLRVAEVRDERGVVPVLGIYVRGEPMPRVQVLPTWRGALETPAARLQRADLEQLAARVYERKLTERPLVELLGR